MALAVIGTNLSKATRMGHKLPIGLFVGSILLASGGAFYVGKVLSTSQTVPPTTPNSIVEEARNKIPPLVLPPKPGGHVVTELQTVDRTVQVPVVTFNKGPLGINFPETTMRTEVLHQQIAVPKLIDASPEETAAWQEQVQKLQDQYNNALQEEIRFVSKEKELDSLKASASFLKSLITDVIVPVVLALAGLVGAIVSFIHAFKAKPRDSSENSA